MGKLIEGEWIVKSIITSDDSKTKEMKISYQLVLLGLFSFCVGVYLYIAVSS